MPQGEGNVLTRRRAIFADAQGVNFDRTPSVD
jgi:hypothetical protein